VDDPAKTDAEHLGELLLAQLVVVGIAAVGAEDGIRALVKNEPKRPPLSGNVSLRRPGGGSRQDPSDWVAFSTTILPRRRLM
jgi:hypothetical protein